MQGRGEAVSEQGDGMADKKGLGAFGLVLAAVTIAVVLAAAVTVQAQINSRTSAASAGSRIAAASGQMLTR
jgi:hypothetical protein